MLHKTFFMTMLLSFTGLANAGFFGPSNYDECILDGVKDVKTDIAARLVAESCANKFPQKNIANQNEIVRNYRLFSALKADRPGVNTVINKINVVKAVSNRNKLRLTVTNVNWFSIAGVSIGIPKKGITTCSWNLNDYSEFYDCSTPGAISSQQTGVLDCEIPDASSRKLSYCVVGFWVYGSDAEINELKKRENIPSLK